MSKKPMCVMYDEFVAAGVDPSKPVRVYRNLNSGCYSVQQSVNGQYKVVCHAPHLELFRPEFVVSKAGQDRVRKEKRKNVHAYVVGMLCPTTGKYTTGEGKRPALPVVTYNPYKYDSFVLKYADKVEVTSADRAMIYPNEMRVVSPQGWKTRLYS